jgi:hypothetical protein
MTRGKNLADLQMLRVFKLMLERRKAAGATSRTAVELSAQ